VAPFFTFLFVKRDRYTYANMRKELSTRYWRKELSTRDRRKMGAI
jgi:hypothetical protein